MNEATIKIVITDRMGNTFRTQGANIPAKLKEAKAVYHQKFNRGE